MLSLGNALSPRSRGMVSTWPLWIPILVQRWRQVATEYLILVTPLIANSIQITKKATLRTNLVTRMKASLQTQTEMHNHACPRISRCEFWQRKKWRFLHQPPVSRAGKLIIGVRPLPAPLSSSLKDYSTIDNPQTKKLVSAIRLQGLQCWKARLT